MREKPLQLDRSDLHSAGRPLDWNAAIEDAKAEIRKCRRKLARLKAEIRVPRHRADESEPLPGSETSTRK